VRRAALYVRVSSQGQVREGYSLSFQEEILREWCRRESVAVAGIYRDGGESGSTIRRRGLTQLIGDARQRLFDLVLIFRVDRFSRDPLDLLTLVRELEARGIRLRSVTEAVDAGDPAGELMLTILGAIGKFVRENIVQNAMLGKRKRAEEGRYAGGTVPFGYLVGASGTYRPDERPRAGGPSAAASVRSLFALYRRVASEGGGCQRVARLLAEQGIPPPRSAWGHATVHQILRNPVYAGDFVYSRRSHRLNRPARRSEPSEWVLVRDAHEALIPRGEWEEVQRLLQARKGGRCRRAAEPAPALPGSALAGFLRCGHCGAALTPRRPSRGPCRVYYTCASRYSAGRLREGSACRHFPWLRGDRLESLIWEGAVRLATDDATVKALGARLAGGTADGAERKAVRLAERRLAGLLQQADRLAAAFLQGEMPEHLWRRQLQRLEAERAAAEAEADRARRETVRAERRPAISREQIGLLLRETMEGLAVSLRREALGILVGPRGICISPEGEVRLAVRIPVPGGESPPAQSRTDPSRQDGNADQERDDGPCCLDG
jgi:site-specific DNA recombinase